MSDSVSIRDAAGNFAYQQICLHVVYLWQALQQMCLKYLAPPDVSIPAKRTALYSFTITFYLSVDAATPTAISKMESMDTRYLKNKSYIYYPEICCQTVHEKPSLITFCHVCISALSDPKLHELGLRLHFNRERFLQFQEHDCSIKMIARKQLISLPCAKALYVKALYVKAKKVIHL